MLYRQIKPLRKCEARILALILLLIHESWSELNTAYVVAEVAEGLVLSTSMASLFIFSEFHHLCFPSFCLHLAKSATPKVNDLFVYF